MTTDYPIVLYLNGRYCKTTDDVLACINKATKVGSSEWEAILEAYANGTLKKWLELYADDNVIRKYKDIEYSHYGSDSTLMNELQKVFGIRNSRTLKPKFSDFIIVSDCMSTSYYGERNICKSCVVKLNSQHDRCFSLSLIFKMEKSIHEKYKLTLKKKNDGYGMWETVAEKVIDTGTWTKGEDVTIRFADLQCGLTRNFNLALFVDDMDAVWTGRAIIGKDVTLIVGGEVRLNMLYVPGDSSVNSFYLGETVITNNIVECLRGIEIENGKRPYTKKDNYASMTACVLKPLKEKFGISFRLPTKEEWCYAAKGGSRNEEVKFAGNLPVESLAWFSCDSIHDVKLKEPNALGFYDMNGNVWEMVEDSFSIDYCGGAYDSRLEELELAFSKSDTRKSNNDSNTGLRVVCSVDDIEKLLSTQRGVLIDEISLRKENEYSLEDEVLRKKIEEVDLLEIE